MTIEDSEPSGQQQGFIPPPESERIALTDQQQAEVVFFTHFIADDYVGAPEARAEMLHDAFGGEWYDVNIQRAHPDSREILGEQHYYVRASKDADGRDMAIYAMDSKYGKRNSMNPLAIEDMDMIIIREDGVTISSGGSRAIYGQPIVDKPFIPDPQGASNFLNDLLHAINRGYKFPREIDSAFDLNNAIVPPSQPGNSH